MRSFRLILVSLLCSCLYVPVCAAAPADTAYWGVYNELVGKRWHAEVGGLDLVSEYRWITPGQVLEQRDHMTGMNGQVDTVMIIMHTWDAKARLIRSAMSLAGTEQAWTSTVNSDGSLSGSVVINGGTTSHMISMPDTAHVVIGSTMYDANGKVVNRVDARYRDMAATSPAPGQDTVRSDAGDRAMAAINAGSQQQPAEEEGVDWLDVALGVAEVAVVLSDDSGVAYNTWVANKVPELAGIADAANALNGATGNVGGLANPLSGLGGASAGTATGGKGVAVPGSYPTRPNILIGKPACEGYTDDNFETRFESNSRGPDVQLHTMCAAAFNYYHMYLNAIRQGYSESDSLITYGVFKDAANVAMDFYRTRRQ